MSLSIREADGLVTDDGDVTMTCQITLSEQEEDFYIVNVRNYKLTRPPLGGHREVRTVEKTTRLHTGPATYLWYVEGPE